MTCFRLVSASTKTNSLQQQQQQQHLAQPFVAFSPHQDRASLMTSGRRGSASGTGGRRRRTRVSKVRVVNGRVSLRVGGLPGVQRIGAGQLVRFVPLNKLRAAAKRVLGGGRGRRRRVKRGRVGKRRTRKGRKRRKGRRRRRTRKRNPLLHH